MGRREPLQQRNHARDIPGLQQGLEAVAVEKVLMAAGTEGCGGRQVVEVKAATRGCRGGSRAPSVDEYFAYICPYA